MTEKQQECLRSILKELGESSSLHGGAKIVSAHQLTVKILWLLLLAGAFAHSIFQVKLLSDEYYSYPIQTSVTLNFAKLPMPAVTICNANPIKYSVVDQLDGTTLGELLKMKNYRISRPVVETNDAGSPETGTQQISGDTDGPPSGYPLVGQSASTGSPPHITHTEGPTTDNANDGTTPGNPTDGPLPDKPPDGTPPSNSPDGPPASNPQDGPPASNPPDGPPDGPPTSNPSDGPPPSNPPNGPPDGPPPSKPPDGPPPSHPPDGPPPSNPPDGPPDGPPPSNPPDGPPTSNPPDGPPDGPPPSNPPDGPPDGPPPDKPPEGPPFSNAPDGPPSSNAPDGNTPDKPANGPSPKKPSEGPPPGSSLGGQSGGKGKSLFEAWKDRIYIELKSLPVAERNKMGHQLDDMLHSIMYRGYLYSLRQDQVRVLTSPILGNCYIINTNETTQTSGPITGLRLILNVEGEEYLRNFALGLGIRLSIHEPWTLSTPESDSILLQPGQETDIGLRLVRFNRLGGSYGDCQERSINADGYTYSIVACQEICLRDESRSVCGCTPYNAPEDGNQEYAGRVCRADILQDMICVSTMTERIRSGEVTCNCPPKCFEDTYTKTITSRNWPNSVYLKYLMGQSCKRNISSMATICGEYRSNSTISTMEDVSKYGRNFVSVNIYFEDLNYHAMVEEPVYTPMRFLSSIGGTMGFYIGASFLTYVESLHLLIELCRYMKWKFKQRNE